MRIVVATGFEEAYAWTDLAERLSADYIAVFSPLLFCRDFIDEELAIEPNQGNLARLAVRLRDVIEEEARDAFWGKFLWELQGIEHNNSVFGPEQRVERLLLLNDIVSPVDIVSLRKASVHTVTVMSCGDSPIVAEASDYYHDTVLELDHFVNLVLSFFGLPPQVESDEEPEEQEEEEPVEESAC